MNRENFKKIIQLCCPYKANKRFGDYELPTGIMLSEYLYELTERILRRNYLLIGSDGNIHSDEQGMSAYVSAKETESRIKNFVDDILK